MSNPQTYYTCINANNQVQDLSGIFQPLSQGTSYSTVTGYKVPDGRDFNQIFAAGNNLGYNVGYKLSNGTDLSQIFAKYNPPPLVTVSNLNANISYTSFTQNNYIIYQFTTTNTDSLSYATGTANVTFSQNKNISVILLGGGGGGGFSQDTLAGGGGGGGNFSLNNISVVANTLYLITVGSGGSLYINSYQNGQSSSFNGGAINITATGGNHGGNASQGSQSGGTSINGGNGGNGSTPTNGSNGTYSNYVTNYGSTLKLGGGGGGGRNNSTFTTGGGYGGNNGIGGAKGVNNVIPNNKNGTGYGAGGGGGGGISGNSGVGGGGNGSSGLVIFYFLQ